MPVLGEVAKSDYVTGAAQSYRKLQPDDIPANHPVARFHDVYLEIAGADGVIDRSLFHPAEHPPLLPWVQILERMPDSRYRARLLGTGVTRLLKGDFTGWYLDDYIDGDLLHQRLTEFNQALEECKPVFSMSTIRPENGPNWEVYRGIFPARKDEQDLVFAILAPNVERLSAP